MIYCIVLAMFLFTASSSFLRSLGQHNMLYARSSVQTFASILLCHRDSFSLIHLRTCGNLVGPGNPTRIVDSSRHLIFLLKSNCHPTTLTMKFSQLIALRKEFFEPAARFVLVVGPCSFFSHMTFHEVGTF